MKVRRANLLEDAIDAFLSLDAEDYMKMYRYEFIGPLARITSILYSLFLDI